MSIYDTLNREQRSAVEQTEGPVLILAGAGSGKTRVITHRVAYLMDECGVNPWNILAITFTNKAAQEMRERVDKLIGFGAESVWISTFHSMCVRILRRHIDQIGYDTGFTIYDADDQKTLMKNVCKQLNIDTKQLRERSILGAISAAKDELMTPLRYRQTHSTYYMETQIADAYEEYQKQLRKNNALDFDDLLMKTVELFNAREDILRNYQERFRYIMVDEYQDTNTAQFELVRLLAAGSRNLCVVGDDDQSIYKFRGANIRNILDFEKVYPDAMVVKLEQNYRSTQTVLDAANAVIGNNQKRKSKALWTDHGEGSRIHLRQFNTAMEEASFVAEDIDRNMRQNPKLSYKDFAVLYRTNAQARLLEERLIMGSVPYNVVGGTNFYERREIKDMLAYLKVIANGRDDIAVRRIINVPRRGIGQTTIERVADYAEGQGLGFFEALEILSGTADAGSAAAKAVISGTRSDLGKAKGKLAAFAVLIHGLREFCREHTMEELMKEVIARTQYEDYLKDSDDDDADDRIENIGELLNKIVSYEDAVADQAAGGDTDVSVDEFGHATLEGFLADVALVADIDDMEADADRVLLMTLHSAKGLEFPHVYITGMEDGVFPSHMAMDSEDEDALEEERRLAYVGITRAKEDLTITAARSRMARGEVQYNPISRFVLEIPEKLLDESARVPGRRAITDFSFDDDEDEDDEMPWSRSESRTGYGYGSGRSFGSGRTSYSSGIRKDTRLKATYVKPHTPDEKKPYLAKAGAAAGLAGLQKGMPAGTAPDYTVGDRVRHVKFGEGEVKALEKGPKDYKVTVLFDDVGQKVMYAAFAKLEKC